MHLHSYYSCILYTVYTGVEVGQSKDNLVWLLCSITSTHRILSRHRAGLTQLCKHVLNEASEPYLETRILEALVPVSNHL